MITAKTLAFKRETLIASSQFTVLLAVAVFVPVFSHSQAVTGPIVNAALFIAAALLGPAAAILIGLVPSVIALSFGLLPLVLAPVIPFIMVSNAILVSTFHYLRRDNFVLGVAAASVLKFLFLFGISYSAVNLFTGQEIAQKAAAMMSWPQLLTALAGGALAYIVLKAAKKI